MVEGARTAGMNVTRARVLADKDAIVACLQRLADEEAIGAGDWLLVKGSRGVRMETVIAALKEGR
jgi:UDP-N-acetylmuramyl pentapeptide synthase